MPADFLCSFLPVLDKKSEALAVEIITPADVPPVEAAHHLFDRLELGSALGGLDCILRADALLADDETLIASLPATRILLQFTPEQLADAVLAERCRALKRRGFRIVLDARSGDVDDALEEWPGLVKLSIRRESPATLSAAAKFWQSRRARILADGVETPELFDWCIANGFDACAGHFFARLPAKGGRTPDASRLTLTKLLELVARDANPDELEPLLKQEPKLSFNLLRLVNSVSMGLSTKIASFRHAITVLGQRQLQRWLQLLLYAQQREGGGQPPLMQRAAMRGKWMEALCTASDREARDRAFMVGILSQIDVLLGMALTEVVKSLNLADDISGALLERSGPLGELLALIELSERGDFITLREALAKAGISNDAFTRAQTDAFRWTNHLGEEAAGS